MAKDMSAELSAMFHGNKSLSLGQRLSMVVSLSWPSILAQLSSILMECIDATMVGSLGANASASIGLVATTTWLFWGLGSALSTGFFVQVAHLLGGNRKDDAREILQQSLLAVFSWGMLLLIIGISISRPLPGWLGGDTDIRDGASGYFFIVMLSLPFSYLTFLSSSMLRSSGNMLIPGLLNIVMCVLDVIFNFFLIFDHHHFFGFDIPGAGLGVAGAALGTAFAQLVTGIFLLWFLLRKSSQLNFVGRKFRLYLKRDTLKKALTISAPIAAERVMMSGAQIVSTIIVAPLGTVSIAANAFGITAESLCYMPGYGISDAATTLIGQSLGAGRRDLAQSFGKITIALGMAVMTIMGIVMWFIAPMMMSMFTPDETVRTLGTGALRIEAFAEPMFAASIVAYGVMVGAGYTLVPALVNLGSIWIVRLSLAAILAPIMGLNGVWLAMCIELCIRGIAFLTIFFRNKWMVKSNIMTQPLTDELDIREEPFEL